MLLTALAHLAKALDWADPEFVDEPAGEPSDERRAPAGAEDDAREPFELADLLDL